MPAVQVTVREFIRKFLRYRRAALAGKEIRVRDRAGNGFVFRAAEEKDVSLADAMGDLLGSVQTECWLRRRRPRVPGRPRIPGRLAHARAERPQSL